MKTETLKCDCGCGKETTSNHDKVGWLVLSQFRDNSDSDKGKLEYELHFQSFECLKKWVTLACDAIPKLAESCRGLIPRGKFRSKDLPGLYV